MSPADERHRRHDIPRGAGPPWIWSWAIYQLARDKKGIAALTPATQIGVCYGTAWLMLGKPRRAMRCRLTFYPAEFLKINERMARFEKIRKVWLASPYDV